MNIIAQTNSRKYGESGEQLVCDYLQRQAYTIVQRNYRCKLGEIDIIVSRALHSLVFVEVKTRSSLECGNPIEAVTRSKRNKIIKVAKHYLLEHGLYDKVDVRFDVAEVYDEDSTRIEYYENAFIEGD